MMFENLKEWDTIKIGEKCFSVVRTLENSIILKNEFGETNQFFQIELEFLGAETVRKAPKKYTPIRWLYNGKEHYGLSLGKFSPDFCLGVLVGSKIIWLKDWEVLEIEKCSM